MAAMVYGVHTFSGKPASCARGLWVYKDKTLSTSRFIAQTFRFLFIHGARVTYTSVLALPLRRPIFRTKFFSAPLDPGFFASAGCLQFADQPQPTIC